MPWVLAGVAVLFVAVLVIAIILSRKGEQETAGTGGGPTPDDRGPGPDDGTPRGTGNSFITPDKFRKLEAGMKKEEVAALFGPGRAETEQEVLRAFSTNIPGVGGEYMANARKVGARAWQAWGNGTDSLYVGYTPSSRGDRVVYFVRFIPGPAGGSFSPGGLNSNLPHDIEEIAARRDRETGILNDPKWKTGDEAKAALVGVWLTDGPGKAGYEFLADGTYKWLGIGGPYTSTYRFSTPQMLEIDGYDPYTKRKLRTIKYRVLVAGDEMYLIRSQDNAIIGPYHRQPTGK